MTKKADAWSIVLAASEWDKMWAYVDLMQGEIACFGYTTLLPDSNTVYVDDLFLVPQTASASEVDFMTAGLPWAVEKAIADNRIDDLRFCVHSHGKFDANWSTTDEDMIRKIGSTGTPWFASAIFNHDGDRTGRIDIFGDTPFGRTQHNLKSLDVVMERDVNYDADRLDEIEQFVTVPPPPAVKTGAYVKGLDGVWRPPGGQKQLRVDTNGHQVSDDPDAIFMVDDDTVMIAGVKIDLDELPIAAIIELANKMGWQWCDDSTGSRYFWSVEDEVFFEVKSERFSSTGHAAHQYTDAAI